MTSTSGSVKINVCCDGNVLEYIGINEIYESQFFAPSIVLHYKIETKRTSKFAPSYDSLPNL